MRLVVSVMRFTGDNFERVIACAIDDSVFAVYTATPIAGSVVFKRLGLSVSFIGRSRALFDEAHNFFEGLGVYFIPHGKFFPRGIVPDNFHKSSRRVVLRLAGVRISTIRLLSSLMFSGL